MEQVFECGEIFYDVDVLILGGDMTGKSGYTVHPSGREEVQSHASRAGFPATNEDELADMQKRVRCRGYYPYLTNPDEIAELEKYPERVSRIFLQEVLKVVQQWMDLADKKLDGTDMKVY
ncbi:MAG: hypothetical protein M0C28_29965 [Candidatus Moduliflexus flocculans]|nr:hypothetical protein [Candidatus Moduliflexus flocculans]